MNRWYLAALAVVLLAGIGLYLSGTFPPAGRIAELVSQGDEKLLREPMRPIRGTTRVLLFALDGVGEDELIRAVRSGALPNVAALLGSESADGLYAHAYAVAGTLSILPSTTLAAWASLFTGEPPSRTGVPGNEWFVRETMKFYAPAPVSVSGSGHTLEVYTDDLLADVLHAPTLYEHLDLRSHVSLSHIHRGADLLTTPDLTAIGDVATALATGLGDDETMSQDIFAELDRTSAESVVKSIGEHGAPDLQVVYFPGVDLYTHVAEDPIEDQRRYLSEVIDPAVGLIAGEYRARGILDDTYVVFVSDHGHTPVLNTDRNALGVEGDDEPPAVLRQSGFRVRPFVLEPADDEQDYQATVAYQGAFAYVYLADRSTCAAPGQRCDWLRPPRLEQDVLPVVRAFDQANRTGAGVPALEATLDLILAREPRPPTEDALPFRVWDGSRLVDVADYLRLHPRPELVDLEARLHGLAAGPRGHVAGDVLLLARTGAHLPIGERFYFSGPYRSWHGSPTEQDSRIPLVVAHAGSTGSEVRERVRQAVGERPSQLDITTLILALLR